MMFYYLMSLLPASDGMVRLSYPVQVLVLFYFVFLRVRISLHKRDSLFLCFISSVLLLLFFFPVNESSLWFCQFQNKNQ
jgi:hypothetical protein